MDIDLQSLRLTGRAEVSLVATEGRELTESDIALLETERATKPQPIKAIRESHHLLARVLATGASATEAAITTGYTPSRISILQSDPTFQELVAFYRANDTVALVEFQALAGAIKLDALQILRERIDDDPDSFTPSMLLEVTKELADRTGDGKQTKQTNVNVNVDIAARLQRGRERVAAARMIDITPRSSEGLPGSPSGDGEPVT